MSKFSRKKLYINSAIQGALLKRIVLYWIMGIVSLVCCLSLYQLSLTNNWSAAMRNGITQSIPCILVSLLLLPITLWDTLMTTNRICGPLFRLRREMEKLSDIKEEAAIQMLRFRDGDFCSDLAEVFNSVADHVRSQDERLKEYFEMASENRPEAIEDRRFKDYFQKSQETLPEAIQG